MILTFSMILTVLMVKKMVLDETQNEIIFFSAL